jgi:hypothetical protein
VAVKNSGNSVEDGSGGSVWWERWGNVELSFEDKGRYWRVGWYAMGLGKGNDGDRGRWVCERFRESKLVGGVR